MCAQKKREFTPQLSPAVTHNQPLSNKLYTLDEVCKMLCMSKKQMATCRAKSLLAFIQFAKNGKILFNHTDVCEFVVANRHIGKVIWPLRPLEVLE